jgi:hypothetical protein
MCKGNCYLEAKSQGVNLGDTIVMEMDSGACAFVGFVNTN